MAWDSTWEKIFEQRVDNWGKYPSEDLIRFIADNFYKASNRQDIKVLEVGCGPGANLWYLAREGFTVYGVDGSSTAIDYAKKRLNDECPDWFGKLVIGDAISLEFEDNFFDAVIDNEAITHNSFENSKSIYDEIARVTKKGGRLFSRTFATGCWGDQSGEKVGHNAWIVSEGPMNLGEYIRFTDFDEIQDLIEGFEIRGVELLTRTMSNRKNGIKEWIIQGEKP
jgi:ubiquinone/menaquinone biosynthesis C-methylase UbiE